MTWAVYEGDVPIMRALRSMLGWRTTAWWKSQASWSMAWDPTTVTRWERKVGRGTQWDTPMARWPGEGHDWIILMTQRQPRKEDDMPWKRRSRQNETRQAKKQREVPPLELEIPAEGKKLILEIQGDCKTSVDWVNGHAKFKTRESTVATTQNLPRQWQGRGVDLRQRTADWASHIFREHNKEAALWSAKGVKGRVVEWVDHAQVVWSEVTRLCRFWDGSCDNGKCGAGIMIQAFTKTLGWVPVYKKCGQLRVRIPWMLNWAAVVCCWKTCVPGSTRACVDNITNHCCGCVSPLQLHFLLEFLGGGGPLPSPPTRSCGVWVACGLGVRRAVEGASGCCNVTFRPCKPWMKFCMGQSGA